MALDIVYPLGRLKPVNGNSSGRKHSHCVNHQAGVLRKR
jgi:hypothetical protein